MKTRVAIFGGRWLIVPADWYDVNCDEVPWWWDLMQREPCG